MPETFTQFASRALTAKPVREYVALVKGAAQEYARNPMPKIGRCERMLQYVSVRGNLSRDDAATLIAFC